MSEESRSAFRRAITPSAIITGVCLGGGVACMLLWLESRRQLSLVQTDALDLQAKMEQYRSGLVIEVKTTAGLRKDLDAARHQLKTAEADLAKAREELAARTASVQ